MRVLTSPDRLPLQSDEDVGAGAGVEPDCELEGATVHSGATVRRAHVRVCEMPRSENPRSAPAESAEWRARAAAQPRGKEDFVFTPHSTAFTGRHAGARTLWLSMRSLAWSDQLKKLSLPPDSIEKQGFQVTTYYRRAGPEMTVVTVDARATASGFVVGDVFRWVNGQRVRTEKQLVEAFCASCDGSYRSCVIQRPGIGRIGAPLLGMLVLVATTVMMWHLDPARLYLKSLTHDEL